MFVLPKGLEPLPHRLRVWNATPINATEALKVETLASNKLIEPPISYCTLLIGKRLSSKYLTFDLSNINFNLVGRERLELPMD